MCMHPCRQEAKPKAVGPTSRAPRLGRGRPRPLASGSQHSPRRPQAGLTAVRAPGPPLAVIQPCVCLGWAGRGLLLPLPPTLSQTTSWPSQASTGHRMVPKGSLASHRPLSPASRAALAPWCGSGRPPGTLTHSPGLHPAASVPARATSRSPRSSRRPPALPGGSTAGQSGENVPVDM